MTGIFGFENDTVIFDVKQAESIFVFKTTNYMTPYEQYSSLKVFVIFFVKVFLFFSILLRFTYLKIV